MNWDDLKIILAISRCGTMSGAASQLNVQHSTVSRRIKAFEKKLGTNLIRRNKGSYELTKAGNKVRDAALKVEREIISVDSALLNKKDPLIGTLRITTISSLASTILMPMFSAFSKAHPKIYLHIMASNNTASLANREADVAIRLSNAPPESLIGKNAATVSSTVYCSSDYLKKHNKNKDDLKWLGVTCCSFHKRWTKESCDIATHQFNIDDALLTCSALREGLGVSFLPCCIGDVEPTLVRYCEPDSKFDLGLWILIHTELRNNARVLAFRDYMIKAIEKQQDIFAGRIKYDDKFTGKVI
ncbi:LysR family transcriptional regulator [Glaciecola sp. 33A]|jgi:DNA-binding transcriptional LysR family regulator|uniref:LysR family transcriptional regulator n=1 Tax=Glaciecola sp. 33A TaxID=2057807 RepID=UPI000C33210F|nr:LysR family transcriptional regulator [Glaciecola sp. 33A]PKI03463.1 LysR family transcriptional regulator [Glaciecola sp. 33A]